MKYLYLIILGCLLSCKEDPKYKSQEIIEEISIPSEVSNDTIIVLEEDLNTNKALSIELKQKAFIEKEDERNELQNLIIEKKYFKEVNAYLIDFTYPLLNEDLKPTNANFNEYINDHYVDIVGTEAEILKGNELICDSIRSNDLREKRHIDYKVNNINDQLVSILFYKENFYSGTLHPTYSFDCVNFDLERGVFMNYEDFFIGGSEVEFTEILNEEISKKIKKGEMYYDCWELSDDDFFEYKNNFVINESYVEYYFDDCVMCPSYTGSYSIKIPVIRLLPVLKKYDATPLVL